MKKISIPNQSEKNRFRMIGKARINSIPKRNPKANTKLLEIEANGGGIEGEIVPNPLLTHRPRSESKRNLVGFSSNSLSSLAVLVFSFPFFFFDYFWGVSFWVYPFRRWAVGIYDEVRGQNWNFASAPVSNCPSREIMNQSWPSDQSTLTVMGWVGRLPLGALKTICGLGVHSETRVGISFAVGCVVRFRGESVWLRT